MNQVREIQDVLGMGPVAGLLALLLAAVVLEFVLLVRSYAKQLALARELLPVAQQMTAAVETLESLANELVRATRDLRYRARKATAASEAKTVLIRAPKAGGGTDPDGVA